MLALPSQRRGWGWGLEQPQKPTTFSCVSLCGYALPRPFRSGLRVRSLLRGLMARPPVPVPTLREGALFTAEGAESAAGKGDAVNLTPVARASLCAVRRRWVGGNEIARAERSSAPRPLQRTRGRG